MTYTKRQVQEAIQDLTECADTWIFGGSRAGQVDEDPGLACKALSTLMENKVPGSHPYALSTLVENNRSRIRVCESLVAGCMLEAAALLRDGWLPGDPLTRSGDHV